MKLYRILGFILCCGFWSAASAMTMSLVGVQDTSRISSDSLTLGSKAGTGEGVLFGMHLADRIGLEFGALQFNRTWTDTTSGTNTISGTVVQVPLIFQLHLLRWFSLGAGGYYSTNSGLMTETGTNPNSSLSYPGYGIAGTDYGMVGAAIFHFRIAHGVYIRLEERYTSGSPNLSVNTANHFYNRDLQTLAGLTFTLGGGGGGGEASPTRRGGN